MFNPMMMGGGFPGAFGGMPAQDNKPPREKFAA